jgi:hypothetical protein
MKRHLVDKYAYAARPFGHIDKSRMPLHKTLNGPGPIQGQVRICCNPSIFMRANLVSRACCMDNGGDEHVGVCENACFFIAETLFC